MSWLKQHHFVILRCVSTTLGDKVYILLCNSCVSKILVKYQQKSQEIHYYTRHVHVLASWSAVIVDAAFTGICFVYITVVSYLSLCMSCFQYCDLYIVIIIIIKGPIAFSLCVFFILLKSLITRIHVNGSCVNERYMCVYIDCHSCVIVCVSLWQFL